MVAVTVVLPMAEQAMRTVESCAIVVLRGDG